MKWFMLFVVLCVPVLSQEVVTTQRVNVPEEATWEITRRGAMVQQTGTTKAGDEDIIADALAPPEDDSHKWFLTVIAKKDCPACDRLKYDFIHHKSLKAWVNVDNPAQSVMHYHVRMWEDSTQADWLRGLKDIVIKHGVPAVVIQPPKNGEYGDNANVVCVIHGYDGDAEALTKKMREKIITYIKAIKAKEGIRHTGVNAKRESEGHGQIGVDPPFDVPNKNNPVQPQNEWPPIQPLTIQQIKALIPEADSEFLLDALAKQTTNPQQLLTDWQLYQLKKKPVEPEQPQPIPAPKDGLTLSLYSLVMLVIAGNIPALIVLGLQWLRNYRKAQGQPEILDTQQFTTLTGLLNGLDKEDLANLLNLLKKKQPAK